TPGIPQLFLAEAGRGDHGPPGRTMHRRLNDRPLPIPRAPRLRGRRDSVYRFYGGARLVGRDLSRAAFCVVRPTQSAAAGLDVALVLQWRATFPAVERSPR